MLYEGKQLLYGTGNYIMYLRKSRKDLEAEQRGEGDTLTRHFNMLNELAKQMRINVTVILEEIVSGDTIAARPKMQRVLQLVETCNYDGVLVVEVERLSRGDTSDQGIVAKTFKYSGTKIVTPHKTYDPDNEYDEEYFEFGLFMSRREYATIKRRLTQGLHASRSEGKYVGSVAPYGYKPVKLKKQKGFTLEIIPEEAEQIRIIFDLCTIGDENGNHLGRARISDYLNEHGYRYRGQPWTAERVARTMINEVYKGYIADGKRKAVKKVVNGVTVSSRPLNRECGMYKGLHEPIVSEEQFDLAQRITRGRNNSSLNRSRSLQNPFAGLVYCSVCGRCMLRKVGQHAPDSLICPTRGCSTVSVQIHVFEKRVLEALKLWLSDYKITPEEISSGNEEKTSYRANIELLQRELVELDKQYENTYSLLERGIYTEEMFLRRNSAVKGELDAVQSQLDELQMRLQELTEKEEQKRAIIPKVQHILDCYQSIESPAGKSELLKEVIDHIDYERSVRSRKHPDNFTIKIFPRLK